MEDFKEIMNGDGNTVMPMMMLGSEKKPEYFVFSSHGPLAIGFKPMANRHSNGLLIGGRIRLANSPDTSKEEEINVYAYLQDNPMLFEFTNVGFDRASRMIGVMFPPPFLVSVSQIYERLQKGQFFEQMVKHLGEFFVLLNPEALLSFLKYQYDEHIKKMAKSAEHMVSILESAKKFYESEELFDFSSKKLTDD